MYLKAIIPKSPKQNSRNWLRSPISDGGQLIILVL